MKDVNCRTQFKDCDRKGVEGRKMDAKEFEHRLRQAWEQYERDKGQAEHEYNLILQGAQEEYRRSVRQAWEESFRNVWGKENGG